MKKDMKTIVNLMKKRQQIMPRNATEYMILNKNIKNK